MVYGFLTDYLLYTSQFDVQICLQILVINQINVIISNKLNKSN
jgi:hypothetical protein